VTKAKSYIKEGEQWQTRETKIKEAANNPAAKAVVARRAVSKVVDAEVAAARAAAREVAAVAAAKAVTANQSVQH
jgi:hypothetical protein